MRLILWHPFRVSRRLHPGKTSGNGRRVVRGEVRENRRLSLAVLRASGTGVFLLKLLYIWMASNRNIMSRCLNFKFQLYNTYTHTQNVAFLYYSMCLSKYCKMFQPFKILNNWREITDKHTKQMELWASFWFSVKKSSITLLFKKYYLFLRFFKFIRRISCF